jgi:hypothetical protein
MSAEPPAMREKAGATMRRHRCSSRRFRDMLVVVSAAYIGVMAAVFTKGVQMAKRTYRQAHEEE